ncbi:bacillithiol biosynthesis deacetylase BshB1 [bacterium]|nr:bacillithiol biosynthesis deacetylase BshB1 [bacterium]
MDTRLPIDQNVEIMAIGAHPKDVEIGVGGILLKMAHRGYTTVICDLTGDKTSTDGNIEERSFASEKAAKILHASDRINLNSGDLQQNSSINQIHALARYLRMYRPEIILAPYWEDWHLSNYSAVQIIQNAIHLAGLKEWDESLQPYNPLWLSYYPLEKPTIPQIAVNITSTFEAKIEAVNVYRSQFNETSPFISPFSTSHKDYLFHIESRARYFGSLINCRFGEGLIIDRPISIDDICEFINP